LPSGPRILVRSLVEDEGVVFERAGLEEEEEEDFDVDFDGCVLDDDLEVDFCSVECG
jgi:hypothetical protein